MTVVTTLLVLLLAGNLKSELDGLIEAERAFARLSVEKGSRDAFLANLSDESILFRPGPVPGKQWMEKSARTIFESGKSKTPATGKWYWIW